MAFIDDSGRRLAPPPAPKASTPAPTRRESPQDPSKTPSVRGPQYRKMEDLVTKDTAWTPKVSEDYLSLLQKRGWKTPEPSKPVNSMASLMSAKPKQLSPFTYEVSESEAKVLEEMVGGAYGYTAPTSSVAPPAPGASGYALPSNATSPENSLEMEVENKSVTMTPAEFDKLNRAQQQAVRFNTLLVQAREKDLKGYEKLATGVAHKEYDNTVREMFGEGGGSETYAPETVALLKSVDFKALGQDLDEYLSLERAIDVNELADFKISKDMPNVLELPEVRSRTQPNKTTELQARQESNLALLDQKVVQQSNAAIKKAMTDAYEVLHTFQATMAGVRLPDVLKMGGTEEQTGLGKAKDMFGYPVKAAEGAPLDDTSAFYQATYEYLQDKKNTDLSGLQDQFVQAGATDKDIADLFDYVNRRSIQELTWGRPKQMRDKNQRTPEEIRIFAGLGS